MPSSRWLVPVVPVLAALVLAACGGGSAYRSLAELERAQKTTGWTPIGHFGDAWPATVVAEQRARDAIDFTLADGQRQTYSGFAGYELKVLRLRGANDAEVAVVLRSNDRTTPAMPR